MTLSGYSQGLQTYLASPQGVQVSNLFINELHKINFSHEGGHLMQFGGSHIDPWLSLFPHSHPFVVNPTMAKTKKNLFTNPVHLPLQRNCVDCVLMPLYLEGYLGDLRALFDELDRVMRSCGYLIIWGINPVGMWGILKHFHLINTPSKRFNLRYPLLLKKMLAERGFSVEYLNGFYFLPPIQSQAMLRRFEVMNEVGMMLWPFPSTFYCLVLKKLNTVPPTPLFNFNQSFSPNPSLISLHNC